MSQGSDKNNSSDDLIAELARLMASDAKGEPVAKEAPNPPAPDVQMPAAAIVSPTEFIERDVVTRPEPTFVAPQPDQFAETGVRGAQSDEFVPAEPEEFQQPPIATARPEGPVETAAEPRFTPPVSDSFLVPPAPLGEVADESDFVLPPLKSLRDLDVGDTTPEQSHTAEPEFYSPEPVPDNVPHSYEAEVYTPQPEPEAVYAPQPDPQPEHEDPIAALIAAQLNEADAVQPGMARSSYTSPQQSSLGRTQYSSGEFGAPNASQGLPKASRDPLDDIESLISAALHNDRTQAPAPAPTSVPSDGDWSFLQPAVHEPVLSQPEPQPQSAAPAPAGAADAAEAAILAATASMRGRSDAAEFDAYGDTRPMGKVDAPSGPIPRDDMPRRSKPVWQKFAGPAVAGALLLVAGLGVYWVFGANNQVDGDAPVLSADSAPVKQAPDATATDTPSSAVFSDTTPGDADTIERLISRDETADAAGNAVSRVIASEGSEEGGLANRKVRTVTVRPDGTIVSGDAAVAGGEQLPVDRPNVPQLPGSTTIQSPVAQTAALDSANASVPLNTGVIPPVPLPRPNRPAFSSVTTDITPGASITPSLSNSASGNTNAVDLIANAANRAVSAPAASVVQQQAAPVAQQSQPSFTVASGSSAPAYVQLSSQRSPEAAQQSLQRVQSRFASQIGNNGLEVQQVNLGERGIFYRVRMPAQSLGAANDVCSDIKSGGGDCFVRTD